MQFTLFVPDLIWPEPDEHTVLARLATPALDDLLTRSRLARQPRQTCETALAALFGHGGPVSYAALRHAGETGVADMRDASPDPLADGARWLCCDPVHLRFEQEHLILADAGHIGITAEEAQALAATLNEALADWGQFTLTASGRGYLLPSGGREIDVAHDEQEDFCVDAHDAHDAYTSDLSAGADGTRRACFAPPLSAVAGRRVEMLLAAARGNWRSLFNEIQMILHDHPVNRRREAAGHPAINAFWLWGAGRPASSATASGCDRPTRGESCNPAASPPFSHVWSDDPLARGLARTSGIPTAPLPEDFFATLSDTAARALPETMFHRRAHHACHGFATLNALIAPARYEDGERWRATLLDLETRWFAPALSALAAGRIGTLTIVAPTAYAVLHWRLGRHERWKFWRRPRPLLQIAEMLARHAI